MGAQLSRSEVSSRPGQPLRMLGRPALLLLAGLCAPGMAAPARAEAPVRTQWGMVAEPSYPTHVCATLQAALRADKGSVDTVDADGRNPHPDTGRLQRAIDGYNAGAVKLVVGAGGEGAFLTAPIRLKSGVVLWVDRGVTVFASRDPADYDTGEGTCGTADASPGRTCRPFIEAKNTRGAGLVGEGAIDGRGGSLLLSGPSAGKRSWWDVAWQSKQGLRQQNPLLVAVSGGADFLLYRITLQNAPNFHVVADGMTGLVAWGINILTPTLAYTRPGYRCPAGSTPDRRTPATCFTPDTAKNTDGFDPGRSSNVLLAYSHISTGDDHVAVKAHGGPMVRNITIAHSWFYYGHGLSLGSETDAGIENVLATDLVFDGMDSVNGIGLRIKSDRSRGGKVRNVVYDGVCMRNVRYPLVFDTRYSDATGELLPDYADIVVKNFRFTGSQAFEGGTLIFRGFQSGERSVPIGIRLDNVVFDGHAPALSSGHGDGGIVATHFTLGPRPVSFAGLLQGSSARDVTVASATTNPVPPRDCRTVFKPMRSVVPDAPI